MTLTMVGRITDCILLAYRTPATNVRHLLPRPMELMTRDGFAFWNIVACRVEAMRPSGVPPWLGMCYLHVAYRLYVHAPLDDGSTVDGLYFVRSDADRWPVSVAGNLFTEFRFHRADIELTTSPDRFGLSVRNSDVADASLRTVAFDRHELRGDSIFASVDDAMRVLKYRPLALSSDADGKQLKLAEVFRDESRWRESPVRVIDARWGFLQHLRQSEAHLELATGVDPIDYRWRLGRRLPLAVASAA